MGDVVQSGMTSLSPHLFWDTDASQVDPDRHAAWLVKRVLEYGRWCDWQALLETYGRERLAGIALGIRSLDPRAAAFARAYFGTAEFP